MNAGTLAFAAETGERLNVHQHPSYATGRRLLRVASVEPLTAEIRHVRFVSADGAPLAPYQPGSHLIVTAGEARNAYSLTGDGINPAEYAISVMRIAPEAGGAGGSAWLHAHLAPGDLVEVEGPRALFGPVLDQRHALLVAGGIGVTPILSHARALARTSNPGTTATILYSYRPGRAAHVGDLRALASRTGLDLVEATSVEETVETLRALLADQPLGTHAYACGPAPLLESYQRLAAQAGWPAARVHLERFVAPEQDPGSPFTAVVASTGERIAVPAGVSLLERLLDAGYAVNNLCRQGVCGECRIPVKTGRVEHRDFVLTPEERAEGEAIMPCVSRGLEGCDVEVDL